MRLYRSPLCQAIRAAVAAVPLLMITAGGAATAAEPAVVGEVVGLVGGATAQSPGEEARALHCGDVVHEGDVIETGRAGEVGILAGALFLQLAAESGAQVGLTGGRVVAVDLRAGQMRLVDSREDGNPATLALAGTETRLLGGDTEAYVMKEKVSTYGMVCDWEAPFEMRRNGERHRADPGQCVIAKPRDPLYSAAVHPQRLPLSGTEVCAVEPAVDLALLAPRPDSAGVGRVVVSGFPAPFRVADLDRSPCDDPGADCTGLASGLLIPAEVPNVIDPPPDLGFCAPGTDCP